MTEQDSILSILSWLGFDKEEIMTEEEIKRPQVYKDTLKEERNVKEERDFVDKKDLYKKMKRYRVVQRAKHKGRLKEEDILEYKYLRDYLILKYLDMAKKLTNHRHFKGYDKEEKADMVSFVIEKGLGIGLPGRSNYGVEYFIRFNTDKHKNVFAFWTQVIKIFLYQYLNKYYKEKNIKQCVLEGIIDQFNYDCKYIHGTPGAQFHLGDCVDED